MLCSLRGDPFSRSMLFFFFGWGAIYACNLAIHNSKYIFNSHPINNLSCHYNFIIETLTCLVFPFFLFHFVRLNKNKQTLSFTLEKFQYIKIRGLGSSRNHILGSSSRIIFQIKQVLCKQNSD